MSDTQSGTQRQVFRQLDCDLTELVELTLLEIDHITGEQSTREAALGMVCALVGVESTNNPGERCVWIRRRQLHLLGKCSLSYRVVPRKSVGVTLRWVVARIERGGCRAIEV